MQNNEASSVLDELVKLANIQDERVLAMRAEERKLGFINPRLDTAIRVHEHILLSIQRMRFDLGLDEYKRGIPRAQTAESAAEVQKQYMRHSSSQMRFSHGVWVLVMSLM